MAKEPQEQSTDKDPNLEHIQKNFPLMQGIALKSGMGSVMGYITGNFAKQISDIMIFYAGCATTFLIGLNYMDYIKINWKKIDADIFHLVARAKNDEFGLFSKMKKFMIHTVPLITGFAGGFQYGFE